MAPPVYALGTLAFGTLVGDMLVRKRVVRALFNAAVLVISLGAGIAFLEAIQLREALVGQGSVPLEFVPACALFAVVVFSTNLFFLVPVLPKRHASACERSLAGSCRRARSTTFCSWRGHP